MTLQAKKLAPDFVQASTAAGMTERPVPLPATTLAKGGPGAPVLIPLGSQAEAVLEAPAGMWGY